jgi:hypothetical protein
MSMKIFSDTIGDRTRVLPTCSAVPQPTAPPHTKAFGQYVSGNNSEVDDHRQQEGDIVDCDPTYETSCSSF